MKENPADPLTICVINGLAVVNAFDREISPYPSFPKSPESFRNLPKGGQDGFPEQCRFHYATLHNVQNGVARGEVASFSSKDIGRKKRIAERLRSVYNSAMKPTPYRVIATALLTLSLLLLCSCAGGGGLRTQQIDDTSGITGRYTLILFNDITYIGLRTVGILSAEGSGYTITPYADPDMYTSAPGMSGQQALESAASFVQKNPSFTSVAVSGILDPSGRTIGYEVRPLFREFDYGAEDVMSIMYVLKGAGSVEARIGVIKRVENVLSAQGIL